MCLLLCSFSPSGVCSWVERASYTGLCLQEWSCYNVYVDQHNFSTPRLRTARPGQGLALCWTISSSVTSIPTSFSPHNLHPHPTFLFSTFSSHEGITMAPRKGRNGPGVESPTTSSLRKKANNATTSGNMRSRAAPKRAQEPSEKGKTAVKPGHAIFPRGLPNPMSGGNPIRNNPELMGRLRLDWTTSQSRTLYESIAKYELVARSEKELYTPKKE